MDGEADWNLAHLNAAGEPQEHTFPNKAFMKLLEACPSAEVAVLSTMINVAVLVLARVSAPVAG